MCVYHDQVKGEPAFIADDVYDSDYIDEDEIEALLDADLKTKKENADLSDREYIIKEKTIVMGLIQLTLLSAFPPVLFQEFTLSV